MILLGFNFEFLSPAVHKSFFVCYYIVMRKEKIFLCALLSSLLFLSCASSPAAPIAEEKNTDRFDDWKYKGFGMNLPEWVENAVDGKLEKTARHFGLDSEQIQLFTGYGINVDQSEDKLKSEIPEGKKLIDAFWVRMNQEVKKTSEPYITVLVYEK